ncbi:hypothetical protein D3C75_906890 [compost metagenome]
MARRVRSFLSTPCTSSPYSALASTLRCGNRPNFWNTIPIFLRRNVRSSSELIRTTSLPLNKTWPPVGSIKRFNNRTSVDLPLPDKPIMTKISPSLMLNSALLTPTVSLASRAIFSLDHPCSNNGRARPASLPNTLVSCFTSIIAMVTSFSPFRYSGTCSSISVAEL